MRPLLSIKGSIRSDAVLMDENPAKPSVPSGEQRQDLEPQMGDVPDTWGRKYGDAARDAHPGIHDDQCQFSQRAGRTHHNRRSASMASEAQCYLEHSRQVA